MYISYIYKLSTNLMLFNSNIFIFLFLPFVVILYHVISRYLNNTFSKLFLVASSFIFYSWRNPIYLILLLLSIVVNFNFWKLIGEKDRIHRKIFFVVWTIFNIWLLAYFKYANFFIDNINILFSSDFNLEKIILPLAISFFTFQQISYLVDSYKWLTSKYSFLDYSLFVSFFPQLIAWPIVHHHEMMPQFESEENKSINYQNIVFWVFLFTLWLFKKTVIADTFASRATNWFDVADTLTFLHAWITSLSYTFQLYFDFSWYTDMALGIALMFNIILPFNFDSPYKALDIQDFWRRWHITLSRFLKDYIYIPLWWNRKWVSRTYINLMLTFLIWWLRHGAWWTFIFRWFLHWWALCIHRYWKQIWNIMPKIFAWLLTFNFINIARIFFRALEWWDATKVLTWMFWGSWWWDVSIEIYQRLFYILLWFVLVLVFKNTNRLKEYSFDKWYYPVWFAILLLISILMMNIVKYTEFIYFNF